MRWYVLHTMSGYEEKVAQTLRHMQEHGQLDENIAEIVVPYELRLESVKGKKRTVPRKMYPGYVLVSIGSENTPQPLSETEVRDIFARMESEEPVLETSYKVNDTVKVLAGPFAEAIGKVKDIDAEKRKVKIMISLFGRDTQVELDFDQVETFEPEGVEAPKS
jgi:transcriptional antiterminator NusG